MPEASRASSRLSRRDLQFRLSSSCPSVPASLVPIELIRARDTSSESPFPPARGCLPACQEQLKHVQQSRRTLLLHLQAASEALSCRFRVRRQRCLSGSAPRAIPEGVFDALYRIAVACHDRRDPTGSKCEGIDACCHCIPPLCQRFLDIFCNLRKIMFARNFRKPGKPSKRPADVPYDSVGESDKRKAASG